MNDTVDSVVPVAQEHWDAARKIMDMIKRVVPAFDPADFWFYPESTALPKLIASLAAERKHEAEVERLREALREIAELPGEINPSNYDHDDACELNRQFCYGGSIARQALGESQ